jgi:shikimate kinase
MTAADTRNVVLTGFMGTGKTTVGRLLAARLGYEFVDTDEVIVERHGEIAEIFRTRGEEAFRQIERELAAELSSRERLVIATGGRMMLDPDNVDALGRNGRVFCLVATPDAILARINSDPSSRPLLAVPDPRRRVVELLAERTPAYRRFTQISTDAIEPDDIAADLAQRVRSGRTRER